MRYTIMRYDYEGEALRYYRSTTIDAEVMKLDPDGYVTDAETGDAIIDSIDWDGAYVQEDWQDAGGAGGTQRRLVWESEEDSMGDAGAHAIGSIIRTPRHRRNG